MTRRDNWLLKRIFGDSFDNERIIINKQGKIFELYPDGIKYDEQNGLMVEGWIYHDDIAFKSVLRLSDDGDIQLKRIDGWFIEDGLKLAVGEYGCTEDDITKEDIQRVLEKIYQWYENLQEYSNNSLENYIKDELQDVGEDGEELNMIMDDFMMNL